MQQQAPPSITVRDILREAWIPIIVVTIVFMLHRAFTGVSSGGGVMGAIIGVTMVSGPKILARRPDLARWQSRLALACIAFVASIAALLADHLIGYAFRR